MSFKRVSVRIAAVAAVVVLMLGLTALAAQGALRHIDGTVASKNAATRTFRITTQGGNQIRLKVNASTVFERISGDFGGLRKGMKIEVEASSTDNGLVAKRVEPRGTDGDNGSDDGGHHGGGHDDGPGHT